MKLYMRNRTNILVTAAFCLLLSACSEKEERTSAKAPETIDIEEEGLHLNQNEKWQVPEDMMQIIKKQQELVTNYQSQSDTVHLALGNDLDSLCTLLVQSCTMTGEAHNVLHEWLIPYWTVIDSINAANDFNKASVFIDELSDHYKSFNTYFE